MNNKIIHQPLQFVYTSHETPHNPFVDQLQSLCSTLPTLLNTKSISGSISFNYAKRMICTDDTCTLENIQPDTLVEIVDYDPLKHIFVLVGNTQPSTDAPVHWLIQRAREDVHIVLMISKKLPATIKTDDIPMTKKEYPAGSLDLTKEILGTMHTAPMVRVKNQGLIIVANNLHELKNHIINMKKGENNEGK